MTTIDIPNDQPDASFGTLGDRYYGIFRLPHGRWQQLLGAKRERLYFASAQEATRAAMAKVNAILFRPIVSDRGLEVTDTVAEKLLADVIAFKSGREQSRRQERKIFRRGGKPAVIVETVRRRG